MEVVKIEIHENSSRKASEKLHISGLTLTSHFIIYSKVYANTISSRTHYHSTVLYLRYNHIAGRRCFGNLSLDECCIVGVDIEGYCTVQESAGWVLKQMLYTVIVHKIREIDRLTINICNKKIRKYASEYRIFQLRSTSSGGDPRSGECRYTPRSVPHTQLRSKRTTPNIIYKYI